jgi:exopolysaccharide biosynthesis polyprenyl glycosylphosphotransferase
VRQIGFQTANNPKRSDAVRAVIQIVIVQRVNSSGGAGEFECRGFWRMAGPQSLASASGGDAAEHFRHVNVAPNEHLNENDLEHLNENELSRLQPGPGGGLEMVERSLALETGDQQLVNHDHDEAVARFAVTIPANRRFAVWSLQYLLVLSGVDALIGGIAFAVPASMSHTLYFYQAVPLICMVGLLFWPVAIALSRGYRRARIDIGSSEFRAVMLGGTVLIMALALPAGVLAVANEGLDQGQVPASPLLLLKVAVVGVPIAVFLSLTARLFARKLLHRLQKKGQSTRHVIVAGSLAATQQLTDRIQREPHSGMKVIGCCLPYKELQKGVVDGIPVLGSLDQVADVVRAVGCDAVAVTIDDATRYNYLRQLAWSLEGNGADLLLDPGIEEVAAPRLHIRSGTGFSLVEVDEPKFTGWQRLIKRVGEIVLTSVGLIVAAPVMVGIAAAVKLQDHGPVIFRQGRVGRGGKLFTMLKFRSMVVDAEARKVDLLALNEGHGALFKLRDDPRITRFGKFLRDFSLDELPQLFNVLRGSMSLVGPRPHLAQEVAQMPLEANRRSLVNPGLTGLWQVSGRSDLQEDDAIKLDLRYVENWSLALDLQILCRTAWAVLARRGAH